jgi:hypothetical protein
MKGTCIGCTSYALSGEDVDSTRGVKRVEAIIFTVASAMWVKNLFNVSSGCTLVVVRKHWVVIYSHHRMRLHKEDMGFMPVNCELKVYGDISEG